MSLFSLAGKAAVVTGSSRGIGKAIAERMAEAGAKVVISSRKAGACDEVAAAINARHGAGRAIAIAANISSKAELRHLVDETTRQFGRIDVLVCNAASNPYYGPLAGIEDDQFRKILENNVHRQPLADQLRRAADAGAKAAARSSSSRRSAGCAARRSSAPTTSPRRPISSSPAISRSSTGPSNVRVNCIAPGLIRTDFARALWEDPESARSAHNATTPLRRIGEPDEIAGAAVFLASAAGSFVTGQAIVVDGGVTI